MRRVASGEPSWRDERECRRQQTAVNMSGVSECEICTSRESCHAESVVTEGERRTTRLQHEQALSP